MSKLRNLVKNVANRVGLDIIPLWAATEEVLVRHL